MKDGAWFDVRFAGATNVASFEVTTMMRQRGNDPKLIGRFKGNVNRVEGSGAALCRVEETYRSMFLRCTLVRDDGSRNVEDLLPVWVSSADILLLVVSDKFDEFEFIPSAVQDTVRMVHVTPTSFPARLQAMTGADIVIYDGTSNPLATNHCALLADWVTAGGTLLFTDRALLENRRDGPLSLFPELSSSREYRNLGTNTIARLLGKSAFLLEAVPSLSLTAEPFQKLVTEDKVTMIAGKDAGRGRILATGINWRDLPMKDRSAYDIVRRSLWWTVIGFRSRRSADAPDGSLVFPREARATFLIKPLGLFLVAYVILMGPVNWFVLRVLRRSEAVVVTLPIGAVVFSFLAIGIGLSLRNQHPILQQVDILTHDGFNKASLSSTMGLLTSDQTPYRISLQDPAAYFVEPESYWYEARHGRKPGEPLTFGFDGGPTLENFKIRTWSMGFMQAQSLVDAGDGIIANATCTLSVIEGTVESRLPFELRGVRVRYGFTDFSVGNLKPGQSKTFRLPVESAQPRKGRWCRNCNAFHFDRRRSDTSDEVHENVSEADAAVLQILTSCGYSYVTRPIVAGLQRVPSPSIKIDRSDYLSEHRRLCVFPVKMTFDGPELVIPRGLSSSDGSPSITSISDLRDLPYAIQIYDPETGDQTEKKKKRTHLVRLSRTPDEAEDDDESRYTLVRNFYMPFYADKLSTSRLAVFWNAGVPEEDETGAVIESTPAVLSVYEWTTGKWRELVRASRGRHMITVENPEPCVSLPYPVVRVKLESVRGGYRDVPIETLNVEYEGRKL